MTTINLKLLVYYIHRNPIHHNFVQGFEDWGFSSYTVILGNNPTNQKRTDVLNWFGGKTYFMEFHQENLNMFNEVQRYWIEET